ncbi:MAG TPA: DMT family transporter [Steroidobacteraceae bacterium]|nr:DMT family transporter [Steroidobacteraceae bacterium]
MTLQTRYANLHRNSRGALWMLASAVTFTAMTLLIKFLGRDYPAALQTFYRQLAGLLILLPVIARDPHAAFHTTRLGILLFRAVAGTVGMILAIYAYQKLPLADANALSFTRTLWLVPLAAFVLKEHVGPRRISATIIGFCGALFMLQPSSHPNLGWPAAAAITSAFLFAFTVTGMKIMTRDHTTLTLMSWSVVLGFVLAIPPALLVWRLPSLRDFVLLCAMGVLGTVTQGCYIKGMAEGDAAVMAPMDYSRLIFAIIFGYAVFREIPNSMTMLGALIVIASTLYITIREARLGHPQPAPARDE